MADTEGLRPGGAVRVAPRGRRLAALCGLALLAVPAGARAAAPVPAAPALHATSAAILDERTGVVLWSLHGHRRLPMASTTKMMTALVAMRLTHDRTGMTVTVPPQVKRAYGETLQLQPGDRYTLLQLMEGMLLPSANDAAIAVAVDTAGSERRFVRLMNAEAARLGLVDTHFANPSGLDNPNQYSSAIDLARLGRAAMANPVIRRIVRMHAATIPWPHHSQLVHPPTRLIGNINSLLAQFSGANGVKTGYTSEAMNVAVGSASRQGHSVIAVVMGEPALSLWPDEHQLLRYAFALDAAQAGNPARSVAQVAAPPAIAALPQAHAFPAARRTAAGASPAGPPPAGLAAGAVVALAAAVLAMLRRRRRRRVGAYRVFGPGPLEGD